MALGLASSSTTEIESLVLIGAKKADFGVEDRNMKEDVVLKHDERLRNSVG